MRMARLRRAEQHWGGPADTQNHPSWSFSIYHRRNQRQFNKMFAPIENNDWNIQMLQTPSSYTVYFTAELQCIITGNWIFLGFDLIWQTETFPNIPLILGSYLQPFDLDTIEVTRNWPWESCQEEGPNSSLNKNVLIRTETNLRLSRWAAPRPPRLPRPRSRPKAPRWRRSHLTAAWPWTGPADHYKTIKWRQWIMASRKSAEEMEIRCQSNTDSHRHTNTDILTLQTHKQTGWEINTWPKCEITRHTHTLASLQSLKLESVFRVNFSGTKKTTRDTRLCSNSPLRQWRGFVRPKVSTSWTRDTKEKRPKAASSNTNTRI